MRGHQRRWEARRYDLDSICAACRADFRSRWRVIQHLEVGAERRFAWKYGALEPFSDDAVAGADQLDCVQGGTQSVGGAANVKRWSRWRMNTSLVEDECFWAMVFRLDGWLVCGRSFARTRRETHVFFSSRRVPGFSACWPVCLGRHAGEFICCVFTIFRADIVLYGSKEKKNTSWEMWTPQRSW